VKKKVGFDGGKKAFSFVPQKFEIMSTVEFEKRIQQLNPEYLQDLFRYLDYLLFVQKKQAKANGGVEKKPVDETETEAATSPEKDIPERLRIARRYAGTAPYPNFPTSKYDVYEQ
jgi:hypothetical protein